ncbi:hypothetical protein SLE2022_051890 [Rubroshorea leprosula]
MRVTLLMALPGDQSEDRMILWWTSNSEMVMANKLTIHAWSLVSSGIKGKAFLAMRPNQTSVSRGSKRSRGKQSTSKRNYRNGIGIDIKGHPAIIDRYNLPSLQLPMSHRWNCHFYCGNVLIGIF